MPLHPISKGFPQRNQVTLIRVDFWPDEGNLVGL
jgi:hypothetical protein